MLHYSDCQSPGTLFFISLFLYLSLHLHRLDGQKVPSQSDWSMDHSCLFILRIMGKHNVNPAWGISPSQPKEGDSAEVSFAQRFLWDKVLDWATMNRKSFLCKWPSFQLWFQSCICKSSFAYVVCSRKPKLKEALYLPLKPVCISRSRKLSAQRPELNRRQQMQHTTSGLNATAV